MFIDKNKKRIDISQAYIDGKTQYPNTLDAAVRKKLGITEITEPVKGDLLYYDVTESRTPPYVTNTPRQIGDTTVTDQITNLPTVNKGLRSQLIDHVNSNCAATLSVTDWAITRAAEGYKPAPAAVIADRKTLRDVANATVAKLLAAKTHAALVKIKL